MTYIQKPYPLDPRYHVTTDGQVISYCKKVARALKPWRKRCGHLSVHIGGCNSTHVHKLVLETFVGPAPVGLECRHLNGDPADNRLCNLVWGTRSQNLSDKKWHGAPGKLTVPQIRTLKFLLFKASRRYSHAELAARFSVSKATISDIKCGLVHGDVT